MNATGRNIKALREDKGLTQTQFAESVGVTITTVSGWETREVPPRTSALKAISDIYNVSVDDIVSSNGYYSRTRGLTDYITPKTSDTYLPVAGIAPAGEPNLAIEQTDEMLWCPPEYCLDGNFFVQVHGDSMDKILPDGSYALIDTHNEVLSGTVALVKVNGDEATIKRVKLMDGAVFLEPESSNPEHHRRVIDETNPDSPEVQLVGRVVYSQIKF